MRTPASVGGHPLHAMLLADLRATLHAGAQIYVDVYAACHAPSGLGIARMFPPLKSSSIVQAQDPITLIRVVLHGTQNVATDLAPTGPSMPAFAWKLNDAQVAAVLTYIPNSWDNAASPVSAGTIQRYRNAAAP